MKENQKQIILSFLMGVLMPWMVLRLAQAVMPEETGSTQPEVLTPVQTETTQQTEAQEDAQTVRVLLQDGSVAEMEMDAYLVSVVLAEMPTSFELEALKAQAVVARTYAMKRQDDLDKHPQGAVCTDPGCCQAYISLTDYLNGMGEQADVEKARQAVEDTHGLVLTYDGALIEAVYFSCSGGRTEDAVAVWGEDIPYLLAVDSPGEEGAEHYTDTVYFTGEEFMEALGRTLSGSPGSWLGWCTYTTGGGVDTMYIAGQRYDGTELRQLLSLNSTAFTMTADSGGISVTTYGHGHRVGMSQYGADAMALQGSTFAQILAHYYPGTVIDKAENLG